jgi:pimeloyl-ACP methyl ester carboxylesterase
MPAPLLRSAVLLLLSLLASACHPAAGTVAGKIFRAPNKTPRNGLEFSSEIRAVAEKACVRTFDVRVTSATLKVGLIPPGTYSLDWDPKISGANVWLERPIRFSFERSQSPAKGLLLLLHGFGSCKEQMLPWALDLASAGYWVAMVDLRGHGASTGDWIGFGALEKWDLRKVLDSVQTRDMAGLPVGVLGVSYGASVGLKFAAEDSRVRTVVALEPFSSASVAIPELARAAFPHVATKISDRLFRAAFAVGASRAGFDWSATDVIPAVSRISRPLLFIHGEQDTWLRPDHSRRLHAKASNGSRLWLVPSEDHITLPLGVSKIGGEVRAWFDSHLAEPSQRVQLAMSDTEPGAL